jgi:hypothetical protein
MSLEMGGLPVGFLFEHEILLQKILNLLMKTAMSCSGRICFFRMNNRKTEFRRREKPRSMIMKQEMRS